MEINKPKFLKKIVDTHQHVFWHGKNDDHLIEDMDANAIDYAWLLTWEVPPRDDNPTYHKILNPTKMNPDGTHPGITLEDIIRARDKFPKRLIAGYCPDPTHKNATGLLRAAAAIHSVRVCGEWKFRMLIDDPRCIELFRVAGELKMPVVLHLDVPYLANDQGGRSFQHEWYGGTVENLSRTLEACPETIFIGHAPGFWREISSDADQEPSPYPETPVAGPGRLYRLFDQHPNLYADLSAGSGHYALKRDSEHAEKFLCKFNERLFFARDYYGSDLHDYLNTLKLPENVVENIYYKNAERLVKSP